MVVGEPTLMGGEFGDEDERLITRLENSQFEPGQENVDQEQVGDSRWWSLVAVEFYRWNICSE